MQSEYVRGKNDVQHAEVIVSFPFAASFPLPDFWLATLPALLMLPMLCMFPPHLMVESHIEVNN